MIEIYCGDGKGKTTSAIGLAVRGAGAGMRVHIVQFLKGGHTSELSILENIPNITIMRCDKEYGFTFNMDDTEKERLTACHNDLLHKASDLIWSGKTDMLILDEYFCAYNLHLFDKEFANRIVFTCPDTVELILTGRDPEPQFIEQADYVSEIHAVKHPYENGISAREGIEY